VFVACGKSEKSELRGLFSLISQYGSWMKWELDIAGSIEEREKSQLSEISPGHNDQSRSRAIVLTETGDPAGPSLIADQANGGSYPDKLGTAAPVSLICRLRPQR
jgi:hypothetical protein